MPFGIFLRAKFLSDWKKIKIMDTIRELYKIGRGPSSSHTMGPAKAAMTVLEKFPNADHFIVELWGSLAATGKGHLTDWIIIETLKPRDIEIIWKPNFVHEFHTNGLRFIAFDADNQELGDWIVFSVGGGTIKGSKK
jgi:L-serine ammonia-lyase